MGTSQQFQIQQTEIGDKTETIVLLDSVVDDGSEPNNDLVSLALTESGLTESGIQESANNTQGFVGHVFFLLIKNSITYTPLLASKSMFKIKCSLFRLGTF